MTQPGGSGPDLIGDFQRWLLRSSARGVGKQVTGQLRSAFGRNQPTGDVWESATTDPTPEDAPECAWCPMCRAARVIRASRPGRDARVPPVTDARVRAVSDALGTVVQDAFSVLEAALAATGRAASGGDSRRQGAAKPDADWQAAGAARFPAAGQAGAQGGQASGAAGQASRAAGQPGKPAGQNGKPAGPAAEQADAADGWAAATRAAADGQAGATPEGGQGPRDQPPGPPGGSPREPDDRG